LCFATHKIKQPLFIFVVVVKHGMERRPNFPAIARNGTLGAAHALFISLPT
jgi:hypothetical protein